MNIAFNLNQFQNDRIFFMDTKPNSLIDGLFTKINYCDEQFTMNGLFLTFMCESTANLQKPRVESAYYRVLCEIEQELLRSYVGTKMAKFATNCKLGEAIHAKYDIVGTKIAGKPDPVIVKISGIWENKSGQIGLSYRIM